MIAQQHTAVDAFVADLSDYNECLKLIRKLRWVGLDDEAARLQQALRDRGAKERGSVLADPRATD
jgi:hypothetical protein